MNLSPPTISLDTQQLTPAKVAWIMDAGESTVAEWLRIKPGHAPELAHFRYGRLIRISPETMLEFIVSHTVRRQQRTGNGMLGGGRLHPDDFEVLWQRIERLILLANDKRRAA